MNLGISYISFGRDIFSGVEHSLYNLGRGVISCGGEVHVFSTAAGGSDTDIDGISVYRSRHLSSSNSSNPHSIIESIERNATDIAIELDDFVSDRNIDWLYVCDPVWGIASLVHHRRLTRCPMLLSIRSPHSLAWVRACAGQFRICTVVSEWLASVVVRHVGIDSPHIIPNSIDLSRFVPHDVESHQRPIVFCNARLSPEKGVLDVVTAFQHVLRHCDAELWLCDGGFPLEVGNAYRKRIHDAVRQYNMSGSVRFLPNIAWDELPAIISRATIVVIPSHEETFGRAALEAMACGRATVATNAGNLPELLGAAGVIVQTGDTVALAGAIADLIGDHDRRTELGAAGVVRARPYSNERVAAHLLRVLTETMTA